ncbi:MAG: MBL fold metallo-hydrolase [Candidatus Marinimicrobia bacterium]|nr:MBL fold metallo-hydrolase [Candidatus Neomarinimicrobiota bacterium]
MTLTILLIVLAAIVFYTNFHPVFGGKISKKQKNEFENLPNYRNGRFINQIETPMDMNLVDGIKILRELNRNKKEREPQKSLPVMKLDSTAIARREKNRVTWFGHSTFLVELDEKIILIDPMFSLRASPLRIFGPKRYTMEFPIALEKLPEIDIVLISHDHYDHLDRKSLCKLKDKTRRFIVPLGVENHLLKWGVDPAKITSLNWWDSTMAADIGFIAAPARHFSGRKTGDRFQTLWCSWVIQGQTHQIYYSGDSAYGPHFRQIFEKFGKFDLALLECGQYNVKWRSVHMLPEETVQAALDLQTQIFMPIHWAGFTLSVHSWTEPAERVTAEAKKLNAVITTPLIGQSLDLNENIFPRENWWEK